MKGTIKFYNDEKGFGFIIPENGGDNIFFHVSQCQEGYDMPQQGDEVEFDVGQGRDGRPAAQKVRPAGEPAAADEDYEDVE